MEKNQITMTEKGYIEVLVAKSSHSLPLHSHECFCFGFVRSGQVQFCIDGQSEVLSKGMAYLIPANTGVEINAIDEYEYTTICLKGKLADLLSLYEYNIYFTKLDEFEKIEEYCSDFLKEGSWEDLFFYLYPYIRKAQTTENLSPKETAQTECVELAKEYIKEHVIEDFDLDELCNYVHMSKYYFIRVFKKQTGVTPNQYYIQAKLFVVKKRLKDGAKLTDLSAEMNFADQSYLSNLFKKRMGISMKDYMNNYKEE